MVETTDVVSDDAVPVVVLVCANAGEAADAIAATAQAAKNLNKHRQDSLRNSVARLLHPLHMGGLFKVLVVTNENNKDLNYDI